VVLPLERDVAMVASQDGRDTTVHAVLTLTTAPCRWAAPLSSTNVMPVQLRTR
jgi:hypothetical protein